MDKWWGKCRILNNPHLAREDLMKPNQVKCETCKHWIDKEDAQKINDNSLISSRQTHYCPMHKLPYDRVESGTWITQDRGCIEHKYYKTIPSKEIEVDITGKPITCQKTTKKKLKK